MKTSLIKRLAFDIIRIRVLNLLLRSVLKPIAPFIPDRIVNRMPVVGTVHLCLPDSNVLVLVSDGRDSLASRLYWSGLRAFEPETIDVYMRLLKHCRVVFDVGANTGVFALLAANYASDMDVHAFEPVPRIFDCLVKNARANSLSNLKPVCSAVTNYDGEARLYIPRSITLPFSASTQEGFREAQERIVVPALKLDTYVITNNIAKVDLLKIDTEGTEHEVLEGAEQILKKDKPLIICEVLWGLTESLLHSILDGAGYRFFLMTGEGLICQERIIGDPAYENRNYLFITEDKIAGHLQGIRIN